MCPDRVDIRYYNLSVIKLDENYTTGVLEATDFCGRSHGKVLRKRGRINIPLKPIRKGLLWNATSVMLLHQHG